MEKRISVVLPAFKATFLKEAIDSILAQSYPHFELIIVDDASPEDLGAVVREYSDQRIAFHRNAQNLGSKSLVASWNHAIEYAQYEYLVLASDDDIYHPQFLEEMICLSDQHPDCDLFRSRVSMIDSQGNVLHQTAIAPEWESTLNFVRGRISGKREMFVPEFMCRRSALTNIGGFVDFPSAWGSDSATWYSVSRHGGVVCSDKVLFSFRMSGINISSGGYIDNKLKALGAYSKWLHRFIDEVDPNHSADDIRAKISPYFKQQKLKITLYAPIGELLPILGSSNLEDKLIILQAIWGKVIAKFKH